MIDIQSLAGRAWEFKATVPYVDDFPLMKTAWPVLTLLFAFVAFVLKVGPDLMNNRPPFDMKTLLRFYNLFQVVFSAYQVYLGLEVLRPAGYIHVSCDADDAMEKKITFFVYVYFLAKISELMDTILFVLRKKWNQVTFLHVYHHCISLLVAWLTLKFEPAHSVIFIATLNSFVHVVMYGYYGLSTYPSLSKYLWWKNYITVMQVSQFVTNIIHYTLNYIDKPCKPSNMLLFTVLFNEGLFVYLFMKFYIQSYIKPKGKAE